MSAIAIAIFLSVWPNNAYAASAFPPPPNIGASGAILIDGQTGQILYGKHIQKSLYPASITKIMTAYLAIKYGWHKTVKVSMAAQNQPGSSCYLRAGETDPMPAVVKAMMMVSGNDAAWAIAQTVSGHVSRFVSLMNRTAKNWGAPGVHFQNPSGLPNSKHVVSALGMAVIARHAMENPIFRSIVGSKRATLPPDPSPRVYYNQNRLLYNYPGALGVKVGYTIMADETYVGAATHHHVYLIEVLLHDTASRFWPDATHLLNWGFAHFHQKTVIRTQTILRRIVVNGQTIGIHSAQPVSLLSYPHESFHITYRWHLKAHSHERSLRKNQTIGDANVIVNGQSIATVPIETAKTVLPPVVPSTTSSGEGMSSVLIVLGLFSLMATATTYGARRRVSS